MQLDLFDIRVDAGQLVRWPGGGAFQPIELRVNGIGLIELVRKAELPHAESEFDARIAAGETVGELGTRGKLAGDYLYPGSQNVFLPSRNLLGEPYKHGFNTTADDPRNQKSLLLQCTCGIADCWFLLATIKVNEATVVWSDFCQYHRAWQYDLGPFVFDRKSYESQLLAPNTRAAPRNTRIRAPYG
jgi:hypothetical protein